MFFFFNDTATTEIYTLSLHDALPISFGVVDALQRHPGPVGLVAGLVQERAERVVEDVVAEDDGAAGAGAEQRSEEHTSELQSRQYLVCRLLLEKKKKKTNMLIRKTG